MKTLAIFFGLTLTAFAVCRLHAIKNPSSIVFNGVEYSTCDFQDGADTNVQTIGLIRKLRAGDRIALRYKDGTNPIEQVTAVVTNVNRVEFTNGARLDVQEDSVLDILRAIMKTEDMMHTPQDKEL